jgi:serine phosphatase RsbU (regulator of sigma subunit)/anti-sigma regulatory factor (Ser/Thr protein kinase)
VIPASSASPAAARRFVKDALAAWGAATATADVTLLTCELVTNAVLHGGTDIELACQLETAAVRVEVSDGNRSRLIPEPDLATAGDSAESGRGLRIVDQLADSWGITYANHAKSVWFRCGVPGMPGMPGMPAGLEVTYASRARAIADEDGLADLTTLRVAVVVADSGGRILRWSEEAAEMLGGPTPLTLGDLIESVPGPAQDRGSHPELLSFGRWQGVCELRGGDGASTRVFVSQLAVDGADGTRRLVWLMTRPEYRDVLTLRPPAAQVAGHHLRTRIRQVPASETGYPERVTELVRAATEADTACILRCDDDPAWLTVIATAGDAGFPPLTQVPAAGCLDHGSFASAPAIHEDSAELYHYSSLLGGHVPRSLAIAPLVCDGRVTGLLCVAAAQAGRFGQDTGAHLAHAAGQLAPALERRWTTERAQDRLGRVTFLLEASDMLAGIKDVQDVAVLAAQLTVPRLADWCAVYLTDAAGTGRLAHVWHKDERKNAGLRATLERRGAPETAPEVVALPLITDRTQSGAPIGTLILGRENAAPADPGIIRLAEELSHRVAVALRFCRAYQREAATSHVLQASLRPVKMDQIPGLEASAVYEPAGEGYDVGGDFYDLFRAGEDRWFLVFGDVGGKGPAAAAVSGLIRAGARMSAADGGDAPAVLHGVNRGLLGDEVPELMLSMLCAEVVPLPGGGASLSLVSAGHPLPLLLDRNGKVTNVGTSQILLGITSAPDYRCDQVVLDPGDFLVCVTDGVTERSHLGRQLDDNDGLARLLAGYAGNGGGPETLTTAGIAEHIRTAVRDFAPAPARDDVCVLVLGARRTSHRPTPGPSGDLSA